MWSLPEAGCKFEPRLWGTHAGAEHESQLGGGLPGVKLNPRIQEKFTAKVHSDNWLDCIAGSYLCTRKAQTIIRCCSYLRILHTRRCIVHIQTRTLHDKKVPNY